MRCAQAQIDEGKLERTSRGLGDRVGRIADRNYMMPGRFETDRQHLADVDLVVDAEHAQASSFSRHRDFLCYVTRHSSRLRNTAVNAKTVSSIARVNPPTWSQNV